MDKQSDSCKFSMSLNTLPWWKTYSSWKSLSWTTVLWWAIGSFWDLQRCYGGCHALFEISNVAVVNFLSFETSKGVVLYILFVVWSTVVLWWPCRSFWNLHWCCGARPARFADSNGAVVTVLSFCEFNCAGGTSCSFWNSQWCCVGCPGRLLICNGAVMHVLFVPWSAMGLWWPCRSLCDFQCCCGHVLLHLWIAMMLWWTSC